MADNINDLREAISDLNIDLPTGSSDHDQSNPMAPRWKDITELFDRATNDFQHGQLLHLQSFTLYDAMSAIEIMDPKMDTGMVLENTSSVPFDVQQRLTPEQLLWIMDRLLSCEMAWMSGHSLSQTIYTCLYFHHVPALATEPPANLNMDDPVDVIYTVLKAYILATVRCCQLVWSEMTLGNVYEEEDFTTNLFGLSLYEQYPDQLIFNEVDSALFHLKKLVQNKAAIKEKGFTEAGLDALYRRLEARKCYSFALIYLAQPQCTHLNEAKLELEKVLDLIRGDSHEAGIAKTVGTGTPVEGAFDENINRKLTSQAPPRPIRLESDEESLKRYQDILERLCVVCDVTKYPSVSSLKNFFRAFGGAQPYPDAFSRAKLNTLFFHDQCVFGKITPGDLVSTAIREFLQPPAWLFSIAYPCPAALEEEDVGRLRGLVNDFLNKASLPFVDYFKIQCHNRSRQRRILCKVIGEWEVLQEEAISVDVELHKLMNYDDPPYYFSSWAYHIKSDLVELILVLGFELELFGLHEYPMIYRYLQYLLETRAGFLSRLANVLQTQRFQYQKTAALQQQQPQAKGKKKAEAFAGETDLDISIERLQSQRLINEACNGITKGVVQLLTATTKSGQLVIPKLRFDDEQTRFQHRFKSFLNMSTPPPLIYSPEQQSWCWSAAPMTYETFVQAEQTENTLPVDDLLRVAQMEFRQAKRALEMVLSIDERHRSSEMCEAAFQKNMMDLSRICFENSKTVVKVSLDRAAGKQDSADKVRVNFTHHRWWPTFELEKQ
ncbi:Mak10 subunit, NatC N-terminal acetyltransferase-domain-containing protein [Syncephalastrum racemosum]|uniref:Mak10 subunit, NatC N-terminal acetyltransferase-domain-containing protein n=1 Tax=Syncephalastrum racemosum TaxID=13706 RepID=A0A1X2HB13_SYNRA|nr:Mak10 subunit, NatC N-terminal acetyltransferase-domain-containing protein [Syncephalastrum racemosum]